MEMFSLLRSHSDFAEWCHNGPSTESLCFEDFEEFITCQMSRMKANKMNKILTWWKFYRIVMMAHAYLQSQSLGGRGLKIKSSRSCSFICVIYLEPAWITWDCLKIRKKKRKKAKRNEIALEASPLPKIALSLKLLCPQSLAKNYLVLAAWWVQCWRTGSLVLGIYSLREVGPHFAVLFLEKLIGSGLSEKLKDYFQKWTTKCYVFRHCVFMRHKGFPYNGQSSNILWASQFF